MLLHSDTFDYSPRKPKARPGSEYCEDFRRYPLFRGVNRAIFIEPDEGMRLISPIPCRKGGNLFPTPRSLKISSRSHGKMEKLALLFAEELPPSKGHILLLRLILEFLYTAMPRFRWIFLGRIHNVHLYARVSNS